KPGDEWTQDHADYMLDRDLKSCAERVNACVVVPIEPNQLAALVSFVYNVGIGAFRHSTLLQKLNAGDYHQAADEFPRWKYANGKIMRGLVVRRRRERELFLEGEWK